MPRIQAWAAGVTGVSLRAKGEMRPQASPVGPGDTELSRLWLKLSLRGVQGIKWEDTSRGQWSPLGTAFSQRAACLPGPQAAARRHPLSPGTRRTRPVCPPPGLGHREQVLPPAPPLPQPRRSAAAGRGKGHFGAEWEPSGMWRRGAWRQHSLLRPGHNPRPRLPVAQHPPAPT